MKEIEGLSYTLFCEEESSTLGENYSGIFKIPIISSGTNEDNESISTNMPVTDNIKPGKTYYVMIEDIYTGESVKEK